MLVAMLSSMFLADNDELFTQPNLDILQNSPNWPIHHGEWVQN